MGTKCVNITIPHKYYKYAKQLNLSFSIVIVKTVENETSHDPNILRETLQHERGTIRTDNLLMYLYMEKNVVRQYSLKNLAIDVDILLSFCLFLRLSSSNRRKVLLSCFCPGTPFKVSTIKDFNYYVINYYFLVRRVFLLLENCIVRFYNEKNLTANHGFFQFLLSGFLDFKNRVDYSILSCLRFIVRFYRIWCLTFIIHNVRFHKVANLTFDSRGGCINGTSR